MSFTNNPSGAGSFADARSKLGSTPSSDSSSWNGDEATQPGDDLAAAKLWAVYISEAGKHDKVLVKRWKSDMEGLLIFAGLFSASLTAFIIESYKDLSPDQSAIMISLLERIAQQQLNPGAIPQALDPGIAPQTGPSTASLACNILWFLSLGLSLSCALIATLVQQWARDFLQNTEMRPSPIVRARIFSYLYFGLQRFGMHTMVEFIPFLLHLSLLLFFAGLVAFLLPINIVITAVAAGILGLISVTYLCLTVLPIISADSPYRTPLSSAIWAFFQQLSRLFCRGREAPTDQESTLTSSEDTKVPTMMEVMVSKAVASSPKRDQRDAQVIVWTVRSLTDNEELEPFVEALPDLIWGPGGQRRSYDGMINKLLDAADLHLIPRIEALLRSCDSGLLVPETEARRRISCLKALWSLAYFIGSYAGPRDSFPHFDHNLLKSQLNSKSTAPRLQDFALSASSLARWIDFCAVTSSVQRALTTLRSKQSNSTAQDLRVVIQEVQQEAYSRDFGDFCTALAQGISFNAKDLRSCLESLESFELKSFDTLLPYLKSSAALDTAPYEFEATCKIMQVSDILWKHIDVRNNVKDTLQEIITSGYIPSQAELHPVDIIVDMLLYSLGNDFGNPQAAKALAKYITYRTAGPGYNQALSGSIPMIWLLC
ncbi:hypothetical protein FB45DRAFT_300877 [Roridomyces roridus]|uniref:DUF6535 domain-containing protein n=1 Tax=Roridomyces roridus TaxID=1738132 RepID=A0AAD7CCJ7_9AGAR|nr:hypothetical protein FB45DRAFT_300877 [Roridomyces roridus]